MKKIKGSFISSIVALMLLPSPLLAEPVARIGDWTLELSKVDAMLAGQIYDLRMEKVEAEVLDQLLALEAKANNIPKDQVEDKMAAKFLVPVTEEQVKQFMDANKEKIPNNDPAIKEKVNTFLKDQALKHAKMKYHEDLVNRYKVEIMLEEPRYTVPGPQDLSRGPAQAPITIIEFSDFECPYCRKAQGVLAQLKDAYGDKLRFVFRHYPLPFHKMAPKASEAAMCANEQGKFWPYHDALFVESQSLAVDALKELAKKLGLDATKFNECLASNRHAERITSDSATGRELGITGTPTFFINGVKLVGAIPLNTFKEVIDREIKPN
ncbi:MAG: DsbA family protein [Magnetococcales bacterium]|nr:DsbA family protein [Magnetococcales bacterium]MBF0629450.1 DsbA family protein [Magnetococcales bacterium]